MLIGGKFGIAGVEPTPAAPKAAMLPLHHIPVQTL